MGKGFIHALVLLIVVLSGGFPLNAQSWMRVKGVDSAAVYSITMHNQVLYALTSDSVYKSTDKGLNWYCAEGQPSSAADLNTLCSFKEHVYIGTLNGGVFRSSDDGHSWQSFGTGMPASPVTGFAALGDTLYAGTDGNGIYCLSPLSSSGWKPFNSGLFQYGVSSIAAGSNTLFAGVGLYLFTRARDAQMWQEVYPDSQSMQIQVYEIMPHADYVFAGTSRGVFRGNSNGSLWQNKDIKVFPGKDIMAFTSDGLRIYAAINYQAQHWIFSSDDYGNSWEIRAHEFSDIIDMITAFGRIWAARADGLWYYDLNIWSSTARGIEKKEEEYLLLQNYPNPFNPVTAITFSLPRQENAELRVYDASGKEVSRLFSGLKSAGMHRVVFNSGHLSAGVYFYRLRAGNFTSVRPMVLIK